MAVLAWSVIRKLFQDSEMAAMFSVHPWFGVSCLYHNTIIGGFLPENQLVCVRIYAIGTICPNRQSAWNYEPKGKRFPVHPVWIYILLLRVPFPKDRYCCI